MTEPTPAETSLFIIPEPSEPPRSLSRGLRYPPIVKELAQVCWFEARGNGEKARRLMLVEFGKDQTGSYPATEQACPSANTIREWATSEGWSDAFTAGVARTYPQMLARYHARLIALGDQIVDGIDEMTSPDYEPKKEDKIRADMLKHASILLGIGTAGARGGRPDVTSDDGRRDDDPDGMTGNQRARRQHDRILARKAERRGKG